MIPFNVLPPSVPIPFLEDFMLFFSAFLHFNLSITLLKWIMALGILLLMINFLLSSGRRNNG